jgi:hypothetical protein
MMKLTGTFHDKCENDSKSLERLRHGYHVTNITSTYCSSVYYPDHTKTIPWNETLQYLTEKNTRKKSNYIFKNMSRL